MKKVNICKRILICIMSVFVVFNLTACGGVDLGSVVGNFIKLIDSNNNTQSDISNIIRVKWEGYDETLTGLRTAGLITSNASNDSLRKAWQESRDKAEKAFVNNTDGKVDEDIANHLRWFRSMQSIAKIYNQLSINYCVALLNKEHHGSMDDKSSNMSSLTSKYSPTEDISNRLVKIRVLADLKISAGGVNVNAFNDKNAWLEDMKTKEDPRNTGHSSDGDMIPVDETQYASLNANYKNSNLCVYKSEHKEIYHPAVYDEEGNLVSDEYWEKYRWYWVYQRGNAEVGKRPDNGQPISQGDILSAVTSTNLPINPIFSDADIPKAVQKDTSNSGYRTLRGDGTNTGSNDIDINVDKYAFNIDLSQPQKIVEASDLMKKYEEATTGQREIGTQIIATDQFKYDTSGQSDEVYIVTDYVGYEEKLQEEYIIKELSKLNGTVNANGKGKDLVLTVGGVPIMGIRLFELSDSVKSIIGEGVMDEITDGYMAIDYTRKHTEDGAEGLPRRGLIPTKMYVSYISEIDANGFFNIETSNAQYSLKDKAFSQQGSGITEADGKDLGDKYDLQRSFHIIKNNENKDTLLCLQYFGLFRNDKVVADQWFPIGRSFVFDRQIIKPSEKRIKDLTSRIGWWENANGEWDKSSANGLYLSDLCDIDSYGSDNAIYVLEKGDLDSTESLLGKKNKNETAILKSSSWEMKESNGKKWFQYKDPAGAHYIYNDWVETCFDTNSSWNGIWKFDSQGYWDGTANKENATNVVKVTTNGGWYEAGGKYWYGADANGYTCAVSGKYKFEGDGKIYEVDADGYVVGDGSSTTTSGSGTEGQIETALNNVMNWYTSTVYTYQANRINSDGTLYPNGSTYDIDRRKKIWGSTDTTSGGTGKYRGELGQIYRASDLAIQNRNNVFLQRTNVAGAEAKFKHPSNNVEYTFFVSSNNFVKGKESWQGNGWRGIYNVGGENIGDDCSSFACAYINELLKQVGGTKLNSLSSACMSNKNSNEMKAIATYFDYYKGNEANGMQLKKGDILLQSNSSGANNGGHAEIYYSQSQSVGWGMVQKTLPYTNNFSSATFTNGSVKDSNGHTYDVLIRFKGRVN